MAGVESYSEYDGAGPMPNTVYPKGSEALTPSDKLRLLSLTGQTEDPNAPVDNAFWKGAVNPDPEIARRAAQARAQKDRRIVQHERKRYKESPPSQY